MRARRLFVVVVAVVCAFAASMVGVGGVALASTAAPQIERAWVASVGTGGASLHAMIVPDPETLPQAASDTTYRFEYGTDTSYGSRVPVPDGAIRSSTSDVEVFQPVAGLQSETTYHYRVIAVNPSGEAASPDRVFSTFPLPATSDSCPNALIRGAQFSSYLPDCRAYELASPAYDGKEGANVATTPYLTQSSIDGNAIKFYSRTAFGDARGTGNLGGAEYVAQRGVEGWVTHSISPEQASRHTQLYGVMRYEAVSPDLSKGVFSGMTPVLPGYPNVESVSNMYLRGDLLSAGTGGYELLSNGVSPVTASLKASDPSLYLGNPEIWFGAASDDWSHILFESNHNLTPETKGLDPIVAKAYEWDKGTVRLVGILPNGEPAEMSLAGRGVVSSGYGAFVPQTSYVAIPYVRGGLAKHAISADGSRVVFTGPPVSIANSMLGNVYMRIDHKTTVQLNVNERSSSLGPDPNGWAPATFSGATPDDSKVFFSTTQALTDNAIVSTEAHKLYMYDVNAPEGHHLTLISVNSKPNETYDGQYEYNVVAVVGIDDNANYVYFVDEEELLPGLPNRAEKSSLYVWHNGTVHYVVSHQDRNAWFRGVAWGTGQVEEGDTFRTSLDGKTIAFMSEDPLTASLVGYSNLDKTRTCLGNQVFVPPFGEVGRSCFEVYVYNVDREELQCASCDMSGAPAHSEASFVDFADSFGFHSQYLNHPLSSDGHYVFFDTREALVPQDTNGRIDAYEYDTVTKRQYLLSSGTCGCDSLFVDASPDGRNAFFTTRQRLVFADIDTSADLYDARIEGGIPAQNRPPAVACAGEECQGPVPSPPVFSLPASSTFAGVGNPPANMGKPVVRRAKHRQAHHRKRHRGRKSNRHASHRSGR